MEPKIPDEVLSRLSEFIAGAMGLHFPPQRWPDLQRGIAAATRDLGFEDPAAGIVRLMSGPTTKKQLDVLADYLTVGETYFFREPRSFDILAGTVLPELIRLRQDDQRRIRIWSAACCTGEEAYTIAILLRQLIPDLDHWNVTLLATDINPRFLRKAEAGLFGAWSFRNTPDWIKHTYFRPAPNGQFEILPEVRRLVRFANLNLVEDGYPSLATDTNAMDVIFCRNVLMYFTAAQVARVIQKLHRADAGRLAAGQRHRIVPGRISELCRGEFPGAVLYRNESARVRPPDPPPPLVFEPAPQTAVAEKSQAAPPEPAPDALPADVLAKSLANEGKLTEALACCEQWICATSSTLRPTIYAP